MKKLFLAAAASLAVVAPAQASNMVILPNLYAREFCSLRQAGVSKEDATAVAVKEASIPGRPVKITYNGERIDADALQAAMAVSELCPSLL